MHEAHTRSLWDRRADVMEHDTVQLCLVHVLAEIPAGCIRDRLSDTPDPSPAQAKAPRGNAHTRKLQFGAYRKLSRGSTAHSATDPQ